MNENEPPKQTASERMKAYLGKIAAGPRMSKDLTEAEADDGLSMILNRSVSDVQAGVFLIAARMKLETVEENIGYWRALERTTVQRTVGLEHLLQIADPFDGFNRVPYCGFFAMPVLAAMGLPAYGFSTASLPPKYGITFEDLLTGHYKVREDDSLERRAAILEEFQFGYIAAGQCHPSLEALRQLRVEIVKRPMLATLEKMLLPLRTADGKNYLATGYFHKGYETSMMAVAKRSGFDKTLIGNGQEGTTLYAVHKPAAIFIDSGEETPREEKIILARSVSKITADRISGAFAELKNEIPNLHRLAELGEAALKCNRGGAAPLIAWQAGLLFHLLGFCPTAEAGFIQARDILKEGGGYETFMRFLERSRKY